MIDCIQELLATFGAERAQISGNSLAFDILYPLGVWGPCGVA